MLGFMLNLPYTVFGMLIATISVPTAVSMHKKPWAIVVYVKNFWWVFGYMKGARAMTIGHVVLLGQHTEAGDLEHELVHVEQFQRAPLVHPFLYYAELLRKGYRNNKYEEEAYRRAGNVYKGK